MTTEAELLLHNLFLKAYGDAVANLEQSVKATSDYIKENKANAPTLEYMKKREKVKLEALEIAQDYLKTIDEIYWTDHWAYIKEKSKPKSEPKPKKAVKETAEARDE